MEIITSLNRAFDMKFDCFLNELQGFLASLTQSNTTRQIRYMRAVSSVTFFYNYHRFHDINLATTLDQPA
jgi:hypothetical protein